MPPRHSLGIYRPARASRYIGSRPCCKASEGALADAAAGVAVELRHGVRQASQLQSNRHNLLRIFFLVVVKRTSGRLTRPIDAHQPRVDFATRSRKGNSERILQRTK